MTYNKNIRGNRQDVYLTISPSMLYNASRQKDVNVHLDTKKRGVPVLAFLLCCLLLVITVQPLANVIGSYTCSNGDDERCEYVHLVSPPSYWKESQHDDYTTFSILPQTLPPCGCGLPPAASLWLVLMYVL